MLQFNKRLKEGLSSSTPQTLVKSVDWSGRVCAALASGRPQVFTEEEEEKLSGSLSLSKEQTKHLISTVYHIMQQAAQGMVRPAALGEQLRAEGVTEERAEVIMQSWSSHARAIVDRLRQYTLADKQLSEVAWSLHLETASSSQARQARPVAHLQLELNRGSGMEGGEEQTEKVVMQFDQEQLFGLYSQLEQIQEQLDALR